MGQLPASNGEKKEVKNRALLDATAGALAGALARFVVGPLDVLKIRFQVQLEPIARSQGAKSTSQLSMGSKYTGMRQAVVTIVREEGIQVSYYPIHPDAGNTHCRCFSRLHATMTASTSFHRIHQWSDGASSLQGLWRGTVPGQLLTVPYTAVQFMALQQCRSFAKRHGLLTGDWAFLLSFVSGAAAGAAATVASYPFDVLRTVLAAQGKPPVLTPPPRAEFLGYTSSLWPFVPC